MGSIAGDTDQGEDITAGWEGNRPPTIDDVAKAAGVSTASVSRALSGSRGVRAGTLRSVMAAADKLNYQVNPMARALRGKVTRTVGMVVPDIVRPFFPAVVKAVEYALHRSGMGLFLCDANDSVELEADRLEALMARSVDGVIISPVDAVRSRAAVARASKRIPLVQVDRRVNVATDIVSVDHGRGIELVLEHLIAQGCSTFAFVTTEGRLSTAAERLEAYVRCVRPIDPASASRVLAGDYSIAWGKEAAARLVAGDCPAAVVCANDLIAIGVLETLHEQGVRVPEDVAVTGYDDSTFAVVVAPRLTSVRQPLGPLGEEAVRFVTSAIESPGLARRELRLFPELIVRASSSRLLGRPVRSGPTAITLGGVTPRVLPRSTPSAQGVDAAGVLAFLDAVESAGLDLHSLMLVRHGHVVAEGWWAPYGANRSHLLYSLSKSFTSTAIGIAQGEGLLSVDDPVVKFFPDKVPTGASPYVASMKVRHLLSMTSGHAKDTLPALLEGGRDIVGSFLSIPPDQEPGSLFCYNQGCTYTLSAIITTLTGQRLVDYLRPRLLGPLGIGPAYWLQSEEGKDLGYSGLYVETESIAKLGQLYLQDGRWGGEQLVPESYVAQARSKQVDNSGHSSFPAQQQGYGFQFWMCGNGAYRGDGAYGQFCVVVPQADAVIACTAQVHDMQAQIDLFWDHLVPALSGHGPTDVASERRLADRLARLATPIIDAGAVPPRHAVTFTRTGEVGIFTERLTAVRVEPVAEGTRLTVVVDGTEHPFDLQPGLWTEGELPGFQRLLPAVAVAGGWTGTDEFEADVVFVTTPHRLQLRARAGEEPTVNADWYAPPRL